MDAAEQNTKCMRSPARFLCKFCLFVNASYDSLRKQLNFSLLFFYYGFPRPSSKLAQEQASEELDSVATIIQYHCSVKSF